MAFASCILSDGEEHYSQIEKEALAHVYGVKHFHLYLYGRRFQLQTDHEPLLALFGENKAVSHQASGHLRRVALILTFYE